MTPGIGIGIGIGLGIGFVFLVFSLGGGKPPNEKKQKNKANANANANAWFLYQVLFPGSSTRVRQIRTTIKNPAIPARFLSGWSCITWTDADANVDGCSTSVRARPHPSAYPRSGLTEGTGGYLQ